MSSYENPHVTKIRLYRDHADELRFEAIAANGRIITISSESYKNRGDILGAIHSLFPNATINDETQTPT